MFAIYLAFKNLAIVPTNIGQLKKQKMKQSNVFFFVIFIFLFY